MKYFIIFCVILFKYINASVSPYKDSGTGEYYSAVIDMVKILNLTKDLATDIHEYVQLEELRLERIRNMAKLLQSGLLRTSDIEHAFEPELLLGNPINAYLITKQLTSDWRSQLMDLLQAKSDKQNIDNLMNDEDNLSVDSVISRVQQHANMLPGSQDLKGVTDAILRLQTTYKIPANQIAHGQITENVSSPNLTAAQCLHIGKQAYSEDDFVRAEEWFRAAYHRHVEQLTDESLNLHQHNEFSFEENEIKETQPTLGHILDHLSYALGRQGRYNEALNITRMLIQVDPKNSRAVENEAFYLEHLNLGEGIIGPAPRKEADSKYTQENEVYEALCRNENPFPSPAHSELYCHYVVPHKYYTYAPIKEEILFPEPRIVMWHDLIHPHEIEQIKELAKPRLRRATVRNPVTGILEFAFYRTSKSAWVPKYMNELTGKISERIKLVTGLSLDTAEDLQVGNYGLGGHYAPHLDFGRKREKDAFEVENGNRIATIIFYLSDVPAGGATVFNRIGARVVPKQGSAAFWYNLLPNGDGDLRTRHAACPVLVGSKWVMNLWFHERGQEFIRPCNLERGVVEDPDEF